MGSRRAFTLVELLLVVLILGAMVVIAVPNIAAVMGGTQSSASLRVLTQMGRYTRSMALLNQVPCELVVDLDKRTVTTEMVEKRTVAPSVTEDSTSGGFASSPFQESLYEQGATATASFGRAISTKDRDASERILERNRPADDSETGSGDDGSLADAIHMVQKIPGEAPVAFLGYADTVEQKRFRSARASGGGETNGVFRIRYRTNGTCRPYRIAVGLEHDEQAVISVDAVGTPRVARETDGHEEKDRENRRRW